MSLVQALPYYPDSSALFSPIAEESWAVFLDSCHDAGAGGRYDILTSSPATMLVTRGQVTEIKGPNGSCYSRRDPLEILDEQLAHHESDGSASELPFLGGALGYFAYDLGRRFERLPEITTDDVDIPEMAVGIYDWAVVVDHAAQKSKLVCASPTAMSRQTWRRLIDRFSQPATSREGCRFQALGEIDVTLQREEYAAAFRRIQRYIHEGDCYQVNLSRRFSVPVKGRAWDAYLHLRRLNPAPYAAFMNLPFVQVLSSSPERFLHLHNGVVETRPIKGTRPRSDDPIEDRRLSEELRKSIKDRAENVMIVDLLRNDLGKSCEIGSIEVPRLFEVESFASVHHLVSTIRGRLAKGKGATDLLRGCFPGGSITGAPKLRAMEIIEELEPCRRTLYCGAIGYIGHDGKMDTNIAIRTLLYKDGIVRFWAGGGIVADSSEEEEYQECAHKVAAITPLIR
ncbi:MAG TPA: aminodeoxychorismate synthase component I [Chromatiales bacterium]|nr:aminodeoxychorismate synthase component I [Chromatiales bacterium]